MSDLFKPAVLTALLLSAAWSGDRLRKALNGRRYGDAGHSLAWVIITSAIIAGSIST